MKKQCLRASLICLCVILFLAACAPAQTATPAAEKPTLSSLADGPQKISGIVLGGGDATPQGLMDAPRSFVYQIKLDGGEEISLTYTAYPPSPAGDAQSKPKLSFYNGAIQVGDYLIAHGTYDSVNKILSVTAAEDYIETYSKKP